MPPPIKLKDELGIRLIERVQTAEDVISEDWAVKLELALDCQEELHIKQEGELKEVNVEVQLKEEQNEEEHSQVKLTSKK